MLCSRKYLSVAVLVLLPLLTLANTDHAGSSDLAAPDCTTNGVGYWETGENRDWDAGSKGWNQVRQVSTQPWSWQVRAVWVRNTPDNWVETGWYISSSGSPRYFIAWKVNGSYDEELLSYAPPTTYHWFAVRNPTGNEWEFWLDNTQWLFTLDNLPFDRGWPGAQSEAHNTCDQAGTTFWSLQKYIRTYQAWYPWTKFAENVGNDYPNPGYYVDRSGQWGVPDRLRISPY